MEQVPNSTSPDGGVEMKVDGMEILEATDGNIAEQVR